MKIAIVALALFAIERFFITAFRMNGNAMFPAVRDGDLCIIIKTGDPVKDDVVLWKDEDGKKRISRVVAVSGQEVGISDGEITIDGYAPAESIFYETDPAAESDVRYPYKTDDGTYFLLNDFREDKEDSRIYGSINREDITGKLLFILRRRGF